MSDNDSNNPVISDETTPSDAGEEARIDINDAPTNADVSPSTDSNAPSSEAPEAIAIHSERPHSSHPHHKRKKKRTFLQNIMTFVPQKGDSVAQIVRKVIFLALIVVIIVCICFIADYYLHAQTNDELYSSIAKQHSESVAAETTVVTDSFSQGEIDVQIPILPSMQSFYDINNDLVGWITVPNTKVDYPVLQGTENSSYLNTDIFGKYDKYGSIFLDYRTKIEGFTQSGNLVIYGHDTTTNSMFGDLDKYKFNGVRFLKENPVFNFSTLYQRKDYVIFAVMITNAELRDGEIWEYYNMLEFENQEEFDFYVKGCKKRSMYDTFVDVEYGDKLITLSTCSTEFEDSRLVIVAREVKSGETGYEYAENYVNNPNTLYPDRWYQIRGNEYYDENDSRYD